MAIKDEVSGQEFGVILYGKETSGEVNYSNNTTHHSGSIPAAIWLGGGGGTSKCEVIPYREGYFNTTTQKCSPCNEPELYKYPSSVWPSTGCSKCDSIMRNIGLHNNQDNYEIWYRHYMDATRRSDDDFAINHLSLILNQMLKFVNEDTKDPVLPGDPGYPFRAPIKPEPKKVSTRKSTASHPDNIAIALVAGIALGCCGFIVVGLIVLIIQIATGSTVIQADTGVTFALIPAAVGFVASLIDLERKDRVKDGQQK